MLFIKIRAENGEGEGPMTKTIARRRKSHLFSTSALAIVAALSWALHPLRVENVAWITERLGADSNDFLF